MLADVSHKKTDHNTYTEGDWKAYNIYMMNKWLSMNSHVTEIINFIQKYYSLDKKLHYRMLSDILPKQKILVNISNIHLPLCGRRHSKTSITRYQESTEYTTLYR